MACDTYSYGKRSWKVGAGGGAQIFGMGGSGNLSLEKGAGDVSSETEERVYDPLWANSRALLDYLYQRCIIKTNVTHASIGQFVLVKGILTVLDLSMIKDAYSDGPIAKFIKQSLAAGTDAELAPGAAGSRQERRKANRELADQRKHGSAQQQNFMDAILALTSMLPHSVHMRLFADDFNFWMTPAAEYLVGSAAELVLKHGTVISGEWHVLGILDAYPNGPIDGQIVPLSDEMANLLGGTPLGNVAAHIGPMARQFVGRPATAYGLMPLMIFREISG